MKHFIIVSLLFVAAFGFAKEQKLTTAIVEKTDNYTITIEFTAMTDEARVYFVTAQSRYEEGFALNRIKDRLEKFLVDTREEHGYYQYKKVRSSETKHNLKKKEITYIEHILFTKK
ncbi:MAG: hypothetical protein ACRC4W_03210 [Treponemataceae bacterium]